MKAIVLFYGFSALLVCRADPVIIWGDHSFGQTNVPAGATNVVALAGGDAHCLALRADGTVVAWGYTNSGQTYVPTNLSNVVGITAGFTHSLALRNDGAVVQWGKFSTIQLPWPVPADATNVVALAQGPGAQHALILRADGTVEDWGCPYWGLTNIPPMARSVVAVAVGSFHSLALRSDGRVVAWGTSSPSATNVPTAASNIVAIAAGYYDNAALRADGTVLTWGGSSSALGWTNIIDVVRPFNYQGGSTSYLLALKGDGTLQASPQTPLPKYPTNYVTAITAESGDGLALVGTGPPVFSGVAVNRTVAVGSPAYFRAVAVGAMPMSYQWTCNGTNVPSATNTVLVLTNVQPPQAGNYYSLIASNALGTATNGAMLLNELPVEFVVQPQALSVFAGATATFSTAYTNGVGPFAFQWQFGNTNLPGATNSSLSLTNVQLNQAGTYSLVVSNSYGSVTNKVALTVMPLVFNTRSTNFVMTTNGLQFRLDSVYAANSVLIFASTDLVSWLPIFTNPPATGAVLFLDSAATNMPQRFYRALEQ